MWPISSGGSGNLSKLVAKSYADPFTKLQNKYDVVKKENESLKRRIKRLEKKIGLKKWKIIL